jgi:hypothetical protein
MEYMYEVVGGSAEWLLRFVPGVPTWSFALDIKTPLSDYWPLKEATGTSAASIGAIQFEDIREHVHNQCACLLTAYLFQKTVPRRCKEATTGSIFLRVVPGEVNGKRTVRYICASVPLQHVLGYLAEHRSEDVADVLKQLAGY